MKTDYDPLSDFKPKAKVITKQKQKKENLFTIDEEVNNNDSENVLSNIKATAKLNKHHIENEEIEEKEPVISNIPTMKKRHSSITFSQRMLKKADNLTKFNRKNHSEGNKHITNDCL